MIRLDTGGFPVGGNGLFLLAQRFQRMAARGQRGGVIGQFFENGAEQGEGFFVIARLHGFDGEMGLEERIVRLAVIKQSGLGERGLEFLALAEHIDEVKAHLDIVRIQLERGLQQKVRILQHTKACADGRQQAHALDVVRVFLHVGTAELLGFQQFALMQQVRDGDQVIRQAFQPACLGFGLFRLCLFSQ